MIALAATSHRHAPACQTRDFYDALVAAVGLRVVAEEFPPGSGLYEPMITLDEVGCTLAEGQILMA